MPRKHIVVTFHRSPVGQNGCVEGLRAAVGLTAGTEENTVACIFFGHAVLFALRDADRREARKHIDTLVAAKAPLLVDEASLDSRRLQAGDLAEPFAVASRTVVVDALQAADATLAF